MLLCRDRREREERAKAQFPADGGAADVRGGGRQPHEALLGRGGDRSARLPRSEDGRQEDQQVSLERRK